MSLTSNIYSTSPNHHLHTRKLPSKTISRKMTYLHPFVQMYILHLSFTNSCSVSLSISLWFKPVCANNILQITRHYTCTCTCTYLCVFVPKGLMKISKLALTHVYWYRILSKMIFRILRNITSSHQEKNFHITFLDMTQHLQSSLPTSILSSRKDGTESETGTWSETFWSILHILSIIFL